MKILGSIDLSTIIADAERPVLNRAWQEEEPMDEGGPKDPVEPTPEGDEVKA